MTRKRRIIALAGMLLALAAGATAIGARPGGQQYDEFEVSNAATEGSGVCSAQPNDGCEGAPQHPCGSTRKKSTHPVRIKSPYACCPVTGAAGTCSEEKPAEKCCCPPGKPCENCPCKEAPQTDFGTVERGFCPPFPGFMPGGPPPGMGAPMMPPGMMAPQVMMPQMMPT